MATIGQKLAKARRDAGVSIEDVAHETHIPAHTVRCIERDDFSSFPSVAYAKSFLRKYADFLAIDIDRAMEALNSGVTLRVGDSELLGEVHKARRKERRFRFRGRSKGGRRRFGMPGGTPIFLNLVLGSLIAALAIFYFLGFNASTPEEARSDIARGLRKANPFMDEELFAEELAGLEGQVGADGILVARPLEGSTPPENEGIIEPPPRPLSASSAATARADVPKPKVDWQVEDAPPSGLFGTEPAAGQALRARSTPGLELETELAPPSMRNAELPDTAGANEETADLRPEGTNPGRLIRRDPDQEQEGNEEGAEDRERVPLRAVPVARAQ